MTKREFLDTVFALAPNEANAIMDAFDEYVDSNVVPTGRSGKERRMSKYIIEIPDDVQYVLLNGKADNKYYTAVRPIAELEELNGDYINENYGSMQDEAYRRGLEDAWEAARKIIRMPDGDILDLFPDCYASVCTAVQAILKYDASEAIAKLKAYEDKRSDRIEVGDEVIWTTDNITLIATSIYKVGSINWCDGLAQDGKVYSTLIENDRKTGKHYDIQSVLEAMRT